MTIIAAVLRVARSVRTSDVADALDSMGLQERHQMDPRMRPVFPGIRFCGVAHPMAYELVDRPLEPMSYEEFSRRQYAPGPEGLWREAGPWGAPDEVLVIDAKGAAAGILGSANTLKGRIFGLGGLRDRRSLSRLLRVHDPGDAGLLHGSLARPPHGEDPPGVRWRADHVRGSARAVATSSSPTTTA